MFEHLTVFYNVRTGDIKEMCSGKQDMSWFGDEQEDYEKIFDFLVVEYDDYVMENSHQFVVKDGKIKLKDIPELSKYM